MNRLKVNGIVLIGLCLVMAAPLAIQQSVQAAAFSSVTTVNTPGATPFIANVTVSPVTLSNFKSISFSIAPKSGSITSPVSATFDKAYLTSQNRINSARSSVTIPVFGLYASAAVHSNNVTITITNSFNIRSSVRDTITTTPWSEYPYTSPTKVVPRNRIALNYSFFYLKTMTGDGHSPIVVDTDGEVRWIGTNNCNTQSYRFYQNAFFKNCGTTLVQNNLDGTWGSIADYASSPIYATTLGHHNYDIGKNGLLLEINANGNQEQKIIEVNPTNGAILKTYDFSQIISTAMTNGGDHPADFVHDPYDWFHNNAATYWPSRDEIVVSSRENFVMGIDYSTGALKWILGDTTKPWYSFASLRRYALTTPGGTVLPEGQHAVSITSNDQLLMFDDDQIGFNGGGGALNPNPGMSAPRMYSINENSKTATQTWEFDHSPAIYSDICSSVYQDGSSYLIDYAAEGRLTPSNLGQGPEVVGIDGDKNVAFDFFYPGNYTNGWYADPLHMENLQFTGSSRILTGSDQPLSPSTLFKDWY